MLEEQARARGASLTAEQIEALTLFAKRVWEQGVVRGLSGRKSLEEIFEKDVLDSLLLFPLIGKNVKQILEIGAGAGFPGIPLKIMLPEVSFYFVDSKRKSTLFLEEIIRELGLERVEILWKRGEELAKNPDCREKFDVVLGRAVAPMKDFFDRFSCFVKPGGRMIFQKGKNWEKDLNETAESLQKTDFTVEAVHPGLEGEQKIILVRRRQG